MVVGLPGFYSSPFGRFAGLQGDLLVCSNEDFPFDYLFVSFCLQPFQYMLKVCHIISGDLWAGAEVMAYHLLKGLRPYGDLSITTAIVLNEGRLAEELRKQGITVNVVDESKSSFLNLFKIIKKILVQSPPDIIHSHRYKENFLAYLTSRSIHDIKLIVTQHGMPEVYGENSSLKQRLITKGNFLDYLCSLIELWQFQKTFKRPLSSNSGLESPRSV